MWSYMRQIFRLDTLVNNMPTSVLFIPRLGMYTNVTTAVDHTDPELVVYFTSFIWMPSTRLDQSNRWSPVIMLKSFGLPMLVSLLVPQPHWYDGSGHKTTSCLQILVRVKHLQQGARSTLNENDNPTFRVSVRPSHRQTHTRPREHVS
jgi:hypothetical protein